MFQGKIEIPDGRLSPTTRSRPHAARWRLPPIWLTLIAAALLDWWLWPLNSTDMTAFLLPWFDHLVASGQIAAFAQPFSNYTPPYLYALALASLFAGWLPAVTLIKLLSLAGTGALALAMARLLRTLDASDPARGAALVFLLPSVAANAALLGQSDAFWAAPCVMAVAAAIDRRHAAMLVWCGVALSFQLQAVLVAPIFLALLIQRRIPLRLWLLAPLATAAMMIPAAAAGWPVADLASIYFRQGDRFSDLARNAPNLWSIVQLFPISDHALLGLAFTLAIGASAAFIARFSATPVHGRAVLAAALFAILVTAGLLPKMHERYFFLADILALALALSDANSRSWHLAVLVQIASILALFAYASGIASFAAIAAVPMLIATCRLGITLLRPAANDNPVLMRKT